jgi:hypothetical protein
MLIFPLKILEVKNGLLPVYTEQVKRGESVIYGMDYCKYVDAHSTITTSFVNGIIFSQSPTSINTPEGCHFITVKTFVPYHLPSGDYYIELELEYHLNALREEKYKLKTEKFTVLNDFVPRVASTAADLNGTTIILHPAPLLPQTSESKVLKETDHDAAGEGVLNGSR